MIQRTVKDYDEETRFVVWILLLISIFIVWCTLVIGYIRFKGILSLMIVQKRYPRIVLFESLLSIIVPLTYTPLYVTVLCDLQLFKPYHETIYILTWLSYPICHGIVFCEVCRLWLICFDINYSHSSKNNAWKSHINNKFTEKNWWLNNRKTFGNYDYVTRRLLIWGISSGITATILILTAGYSQVTQFIDGCLYGLPVLVVIYSYYKCPKVNKDKFLFELEFRSTTIIFTVSLFTYFVAQVVYFFDLFVAQIMIVFTANIAFSFVSILSTMYIPKKILSKMEWFDEFHDRVHPENGSKLEEIFSDQYSLELFALHLNHEFSLECILSFIEMMQFKQYFNQIYFGNNQEFTFLDEKQIKFEFGEEFEGKSSIVYETFHFKLNEENGSDETNVSERTDGIEIEKDLMIKNFKLISYLLYKKYINERSEMEVNISSTLRSQYNELMKDKDEWINNIEILPNDLLTIFDDVCCEMFTLMEHSFGRFKRTDEYTNLLETRNSP